MHFDCDVVVSGASGSGLHAAENLARAGRSVVVLERRERVGERERTWIVTPHLLEMVGEIPPEIVVHRTGVMELRAGRAVERVRLDPPDLIVERSRLLPWLAERARAAGAEIHLGVEVDRIRPGAGGIEVLCKRRGGGEASILRARHLIGADGAASTIAEHTERGPQDSYPIVQAIVQLPGGYDPDVTRVWFDRELTRFFYWLIPHSPREGVLGLVAESPGRARPDLEEFVEREGFRPLAYQGAMIPLHRPGRRVEGRVGDGRVLLVGDAAAQVKVTTVGGVVTGLWGAKAATRALVQGTSYGSELRGLHRELWLHDLIRWSMDRFRQEDYVRLIEMMNPSLRQILTRRNRDSMAGAWWRLLLAQPRIISLGLRTLVSPHRSTDTGGGVRVDSKFTPARMADSGNTGD